MVKRAEDTSEDARHACAARAAGGHGALCGVPSLATRQCQHKGGRRQPSDGRVGRRAAEGESVGWRPASLLPLACERVWDATVRLLGVWRCLPACGGSYALIIWVCQLRAVCARAIPECAHPHTTCTHYVSAEAGRATQPTYIVPHIRTQIRAFTVTVPHTHRRSATQAVTTTHAQKHAAMPLSACSHAAMPLSACSHAAIC